jgi:hypothetical protein
MKRNSIGLRPQAISRPLASPIKATGAQRRAGMFISRRRKLQEMPPFDARRQTLCSFYNPITPYRLSPRSRQERGVCHFVTRSSHSEDRWHHREHTASGEGCACRQRLLVATLAGSEAWQRFTGWQKKSAEYVDPLARRMPLAMVSTSFIQPERDTRLKQ